MIGAGTVLQPAEVTKIAEIGGKLIVSPNCDVAVISAAARAGIDNFAGRFYRHGMFCGVKCRGIGVKFFPANLLQPRGLLALKAVLPKNIPTFAVGGVSIEKNDENNSISEWVAAGIAGLALVLQFIAWIYSRPGFRKGHRIRAAFDRAMADR